MMTTLAGIWGMNFEFMPELKWKMGYPVALLLMPQADWTWPLNSLSVGLW